MDTQKQIKLLQIIAMVIIAIWLMAVAKSIGDVCLRPDVRFNSEEVSRPTTKSDVEKEREISGIHIIKHQVMR